MNVTNDRRREHLELARTEEAARTDAAHSSTPTASSTTRAGANVEDAVERLPVSTDYSVFLAHVRAAPSGTSTSPAPREAATVRTSLVNPTLGSARDVGMQQRLDAFRDRFSGPYDVGGTKVPAPPMFRMNVPGAPNAKKKGEHEAELAQICAKAGCASAAGPASVGRPTPEQLVRVTQALLDAGKLPPADAAHQTVAERIRGMQWEWAIGVDCAGYTQPAAAAAHGPAGKVFEKNLMGDVFSGMMTDRRFQTVAIVQIRPGDVIHLESPKAGEVGHNVICHDHAIMSEATRNALFASRATGEEGKAFLRGAGPFHVLEVDSSWGAGDGSMVGGFRRDTWIYDESSFTWASYPSGQRQLPLAVHELTGPQDELFGGAFRPREGR